MTGWPKEEIPDEDRLLRWAHRAFCPDGELGPGIIRSLDGGMSTNWEKYSTAEETRQQARNPDDNGVVQMIAGRLRQLPGVSVEHDPVPENRAHTLVLGPAKDPEVRLKMLRACEWAIRIPARAG